MNKIFKLIVLFFLGSMAINLSAAHLVGTEARYVCNGGTSYTLHFSLYMEPTGLNPGNSAIDDSVTVAIYDLDNTSRWYDMIAIGRSSIDTIYTTYVAPCTGVTYEDSIYRWNFQQTVTLPFNIAGYQISYWRCCRPDGYVNIQDGQGVGIDLVVPGLGQCNTMPEFNNDFPRFLCLNNLINIDASADDVDGDSLVYSLVAPYAEGSEFETDEQVLVDNQSWIDLGFPEWADSNATYRPPFDTLDYNFGYNSIQPLGNSSSITINRSTGLITGTAGAVGSNYVVGVKVEEYRNGSLISSYIRDIPVTVVDCGGLVAQSTNANLSPNNYTCGEPVTFENLSLNANAYEWDFGADGNADTSTQENPTYLFPDTGTYTVTLIARDTDLVACSDTFIQILDIVKAVQTNFSFNTLCDSSTEFTSLISHDSTGIITLFEWNIDNGAAIINAENTTQSLSEGAHNITFITQDLYGCSDTTDSTLTINIPNITATLTNDATADAICSGDSILFTGASGVNYNFLINNASVQNSTTDSFMATGLLDGDQIRVIITDTSNCSDTSETTTVTVNPLPTAGLSSDAQGDSICVGGSINFTGTGGNLYNFHVNDTSVQNGASENFEGSSLLDGDEIFVVVIDGNLCADTSLTSSLTLKPIPTITLTNDATDNTICPGGTITFTGSGGDSYDFHLNNGSVQSGSSATYSNSSLIADDEIFIVGSLDGCQDTSEIDTIIISNSITAGLTNNGNANNVCEGINTIFTATGGDNYIFKINELETQNSSSNTFSSTTLNDNDVVEVIVSSGTCTDSASNSITVNSNPIASINDDNAFNVSCEESNITFTAAGGINYHFLVEGLTSIQNGANNTLNYSNLDDGESIHVIVSDGNQCSDTAISSIFTINSLPNPILTVDDSVICQGENVTFTGSDGTSYNFHLNGASDQNGASANYSSSSFNDGDIVYVVATNADACTDTSNAISIESDDIPEVGISSNTQGDTLCSGDPVNITEDSLEGARFLFYLNDVLQQDDIFNIYSTSALENGDEIKVEAVSSGGCSASDSIVFTVNTITANLIPSEGDMSICEGDLISFTASGGILYSIRINGSEVSTSNSYNTTTLANQDEVSAFVVAENGCSDLVTLNPITVTEYDEAEFAYPSNEFCANAATSPILTSPGTAGSWAASASAIVLDPVSGEIDLGASSTGVYTIVFTTGGLCPDNHDQIITISEALTQPIAGDDATVCNESSLTLSGNNITVGSPGWSIISGSGNLLTPNNESTVVNGLAPGETLVAVYTVQNGNICPNQTDTITLTNLDIPEVIEAGADVLCYSDTIILNATTPSIEGSGLWTSSDASINIDSENNAQTFITGTSPNNPLKLYWTVVDSFCQHDGMDSIIITNQYSTASFNSVNDSSKIIVEEVFQLNTADLISFNWFINGENMGNENPLRHTFFEPETFSVEVRGRDINGCLFRAQKDHIAYDFDWIFVPTFFSPNGDGINDEIAPMGHLLDFTNFTFSVFDRWGNRVFHTSSPHVYWNGTDQSTGKPCINDGYSWYMTFIDENGTQQSDQGSIILFR